jgi:fatty acid desaturase
MVGVYVARLTLWLSSILVGVWAAVRMANVLPHARGWGVLLPLLLAWLVASAVALCIHTAALLMLSRRRGRARVGRADSPQRRVRGRAAR